MRKKIVAGNWKMYTTVEEGISLVNNLIAGLSKEENLNKTVIVIPPALHLTSIIQTAKNSAGKIHVGAQNCYFEKEGAYTGEISPRMLSHAGVEYVILGHSERRQYFNESNQLLAKKTIAVLEEKMTPIYCCGETLEQRESGKYKDVIKAQIEEGLFDLSAAQISNIIVAYEPVWAIGTGKTASPEQAQEIHAFIRSLFALKYGAAIAEQLPILYGGSVKPGNAAELFSQADIDGGLVGGAALKADDFLGIINA